MVTRKKFYELLHACFGISIHTEPCTTEGKNVSDEALRFSKILFNELDRAISKDKQGIIIVMKLFMELEDNDHNPDYIDEQIEYGRSGDRVEFERL